MYYYIFDQFLNEPRYQSLVNKIEARLTDLGINGRSEKLTILKNLPDTMGEIIKKGTSTIVAVGNDHTVSKIISLLPNLELTLGIIPVGPENMIAKMLGIPEDEAACDTLSARIVEKIDLGKANNYYFISHLQLTSEKEVLIDCGNYNVSSLTENNQINICNFDISKPDHAKNKTHSNPKDGILEAIFTNTKKSNGLFGIFKKSFSRDSVFPFKKIKIKCANECLPALADGHLTIKTPISVEVAPKKLKIIVGKNRMF